MDEFSDKIKRFLSEGRAVKVAAVLGFAGILLIFLSGVFPKDKATSPNNSFDLQEYVSLATEETEKVVSSITGEKSPIVYITAENSIEKQYAFESKTKGDSMEETVVIIKNSEGDQTGLLLNEFQPRIKGVVVVSSAADDPVTKERIISAVRTAFDIPTNRVCVVSKYN